MVSKPLDRENEIRQMKGEIHKMAHNLRHATRPVERASRVASVAPAASF